MARYIVTCTPPTPNGDLHLGHLSGPFLSADVCHRALAQAGHDVIMLSYSDDYQSYVPRKTDALDRDPVAYSDLMRRTMLLSMEAIDIKFDNFLRSHGNAAFKKSVEHYADAVKGDLETRTVPVHACPACNKFGYEAYGRGSCNWCGGSSDASQCETCARKPIAEKMTDMKCVVCDGDMELVTKETVVWDLGRHFEKVASAHASQPIRKCLQDFLGDALKDKDDSWVITRPGDAGLELERFGGQPVHTWFMGLSGYRAALDEFLDANPDRGAFEDWWGPDTKMVYFLGFDCSYSHAVAYPVQQLCDPSGPPIGLFLTNRFLKLNGDDFSTSRGNAIWIKDITGQYPSDAIRLYTACFAPETEVKNFQMNHFEQWYSDVFQPLNAATKRHATTPGSQTTALDEGPWANSPSIQKWQRHTQLDAFSIVGMAQAVLELSQEIQNSDEALQPSGWQALIQIAAPFCPNMNAR